MIGWRYILCWVGLLPGMVLALSTAALAQPVPNMPPAIPTRQNSFAIPYTIPVPKTPAEQPAEIRLFVSSDLGKSWQLAETTRLNAITETTRGQFTFRAPGDAEYWFAIRTVDRAGQLRGGRNGPELRVVVDSQPPVIRLDARRGAAGEIAVRYEVADTALQPQSLGLSYQLAGLTEWRSIAFDKPLGFAAEKPLQGMATFWPERAGVELQVRLEVLDAAGNNGASQVMVPLVAGAPAQPFQQPLADATSPLGGGFPPQNMTPLNPTFQNPALAARPVVRNDDPPPAFPFGDTSRAGGTRWTDVTNAGPSPTLAPPQVFAPPQGLQQPPPVPPANIAALPSGPSLFGPQDNSPPPTYPGNVASLPPQPQPSPVAPRIESRVSAPLDSSTQIQREFRLPSGEQPRMVNGRTFEWEYELESVGAAGIAKIELWMTRDGGSSWASVGVDPDNRSPIRTMVDGEGLFGYRMTVQSAGGAQPRAPQSGEQPEMWIGVDLTKPAVQLLNAELGQGSALGEIAITWEARDALLARQPVSLAYAEHREGPWTTIAAGLENTGRYAWRYDSQTPERLYLRLEVRDEAGNIGVSESVEPLSLERTNPAVRLLNVRPVQERNPQSRIAPAPTAAPRPLVAQQPPRAAIALPPAANTPATNMSSLPVVASQPGSANSTRASIAAPASSPRSSIWSTPTNTNPSVLTNPYMTPNETTIRR